MKRLSIIIPTLDEAARIVATLESLRDLRSRGHEYLRLCKPKVVKGWNYHKKQTDNFVVVKGNSKVVLYDGREDSPTKGEVQEVFIGEDNPILLKIPPFVVHGITPAGDATMTVQGKRTKLPGQYLYEVSYYLESFGTTTKSSENRTEISVSNKQIKSIKTTSNTNIPKNGFVISIGPDAEIDLNKFKENLKKLKLLEKVNGNFLMDLKKNKNLNHGKNREKISFPTLHLLFQYSTLLQTLPVSFPALQMDFSLRPFFLLWRSRRLRREQ